MRLTLREALGFREDMSFDEAKDLLYSICYEADDLKSSGFYRIAAALRRRGVMDSDIEELGDLTSSVIDARHREERETDLNPLAYDDPSSTELGTDEVLGLLRKAWGETTSHS